MMSKWRRDNLMGAAILAVIFWVIYGIYRLVIWAYYLF